MFYKGSRYENVPVSEVSDKKGKVIKYKRIRFIPETPGVQDHTVVQGERLDLIAYQYLKDAELFWRICDANKTMQPDELTEETGSRIKIPSTLR